MRPNRCLSRTRFSVTRHYFRWLSYILHVRQCSKTASIENVCRTIPKETYFWKEYAMILLRRWIGNFTEMARAEWYCGILRQRYKQTDFIRKSSTYSLSCIFFHAHSDSHPKSRKTLLSMRKTYSDIYTLLLSWLCESLGLFADDILNYVMQRELTTATIVQNALTDVSPGFR